MAASEIIVQQIVDTGLEATYEAANADGNFFINNNLTGFHLINEAVTPVTVTITSLIPDNFGITHDQTLIVPASSETLINYMSKRRFNNLSSITNITYSAVVTLTVAALKVRV
jgi:hypothetical protein